MKLRLFRILLIAFVWMSVSNAGTVWSAPVSEWFDKNIAYDIYIGIADENITTIKDVEIVEFVTIHDKLFLVIKPSDFSLTKSLGYVSFDSVHLILPNQKLSPSPKDTKKIFFQ